MSETLLSPHTVSFHTEPSACKLLCYLQKLPKVTILLQDDMVLEKKKERKEEEEKN